MTGLLRDLRYGVRTLSKSPAFTLVSLATLALGIGANTAIFSFVNGVLLQPLPYADASRIVMVLEKPPFGDRNGISTLNYLDWRHQNSVFEYMTPMGQGQVTLTGTSEPVQLRSASVAPDYFHVFGTRAALGRTFAADEDQPGKAHVVILSHAIWESQFGADPKLLGTTIRLDGEPYTVIGILAEGGSFDRLWAQIYKPLLFKPEHMTRNFHWLLSFAKLKPGVSLEAARKQMDAIGGRIAH
ncbi:MAG: ABC transporter permease, partial [Bryobacteraceae bacterium]